MECISTSPRRRPTDMEQTIMRLELGKHVLLKESNPTPPQVPSPDDTGYVSDDTPNG
jgi:hypothetical protein